MALAVAIAVALSVVFALALAMSLTFTAAFALAPGLAVTLGRDRRRCRGRRRSDGGWRRSYGVALLDRWHRPGLGLGDASHRGLRCARHRRGPLRRRLSVDVLRLV